MHALLELVLDAWPKLPDKTGFHAKELLRNAFAAVGDDRALIARLAALVPLDAGPELRFNMACAYAVAGEKLAMLRELDVALALGVSAVHVFRSEDFAAFIDDPQLLALLERAADPPIPVEPEPHLAPVRAALDSAVRALRELGQAARLEPPARLETVLAAERTRKIQLPNDYRALLTLSDGMTLWDHAFLGTLDLRTDTRLGQRARAFLELTAGRTGIEVCVPLANWGQPTDWLLYDPRGTVRGGSPGYLLMLATDEVPLDDLVHALADFERTARDILGTN